MAHRLTLEVTEDAYESLVATARQAGRKPEALAAELLEHAALDRRNDPLDRFIGAFRSPAPNWADNHDMYIASSKQVSHAC